MISRCQFKRTLSKSQTVVVGIIDEVTGIGQLVVRYVPRGFSKPHYQVRLGWVKTDFLGFLTKPNEGMKETGTSFIQNKLAAPSPFSKGSSAKCFLDQRHRAKRFRTSSSAPKCITALTRGHCSSSSSSSSYSGKWRRLPSRHRLTKETSKWSTRQIIGQNANSRLRPISENVFFCLI